MLKKIDFRIYIIIVLVIIEGILVFFYLKNDNSVISSNFDFNNTNFVSKTNKTSSKVSTSAQVQSALTENVDLHATYYLKTLYVEEGEEIKSGETIVKYTNGKTLTAPYDCVIKSINMPDPSEKITNSHYIQISSLNALKVSFSVSESKMSNLNVGDKATITIAALDDKTYTGYITSISSTASNGKFTVVVEFTNDGDIMLGMTASVSI